jgi:outer membrane protein OmpA-like peptidoglycan-associated protein
MSHPAHPSTSARPATFAAAALAALLVITGCSSAAAGTGGDVNTTTTLGPPTTGVVRGTPTAGAAGGGAAAGAPLLPECPLNGHGPVVLALAARQGNPDPSNLPAAVTQMLDHTIDAGSRITLIEDDGEPWVVGSNSYVSTAQNSSQQQKQRDAFVLDLSSAMTTLHAKTPQAAPLKALNVAGREAHGNTDTDRTTIVLSDNLMSTAPPLDYTQPGMFTATPQDIADYLAQSGELPDLKGLAVVLTGVGDTAAPQQALPVSARTSLIAIWSQLIAAAGAQCLTVVDTPNTAAGTPQTLTVTPITPPTPPTFTPQTTTVVTTQPGSTATSTITTAPVEQSLPDDATFGFLPDQAVLRNSEAAAAALQPLATWLQQTPGAHLTLTGTTARSGDRAGQEALGLERAKAIAALLQQAGVNPDQITTLGVGSYWPGYSPDLDTNGNLLPTASANRTVIATPSTA